jgi:curved DNA-binding protein CbpA
MKLSEHIQYFEAMSASEALKLLKKHDAEFPNNPDETAINKFRKKFAKKFHPDISDDKESLKDINTALDTLKKNPGRSDDYKSGRSSRESYSRTEVPVWQTDRRNPFNDIKKNDYNDINFIMKKAWELSGSNTKPTEQDKYIFWQFSEFKEEGAVTLYANDDAEVQKELVKALLHWWRSRSGNGKKTTAIIIVDHDKNTKVFPVDGGNIGKPFDIDFGDSFNHNPFNDRYFTKSLQNALEKQMNLF